MGSPTQTSMSYMPVLPHYDSIKPSWSKVRNRHGKVTWQKSVAVPDHASKSIQPPTQLTQPREDPHRAPFAVYQGQPQGRWQRKVNEHDGKVSWEYRVEDPQEAFGETRDRLSATEARRLMSVISGVPMTDISSSNPEVISCDSTAFGVRECSAWCSFLPWQEHPPR